MQKIIAALIGIYRDGYGLVGAIAPAVSAAGSICKLAGVEMANLQELSWAWAFAPLSVWFAVAYFHRWFLYQQQAPAGGVKPNMRVKDALGYLMVSAAAFHGIDEYTAPLVVRGALQDAASRGALVLWGRNNHGRQERIPLDALSVAEIEAAVFDHTTENAVEMTIKHGGAIFEYRELMVDRRQLEQIWPPKKRTWRDLMSFSAQ